MQFRWLLAQVADVDARCGGRTLIHGGGIIGFTVPIPSTWQKTHRRRQDIVPYGVKAVKFDLEVDIVFALLANGSGVQK